MMPPTPVAAHETGETALGWLWLSTLKASLAVAQIHHPRVLPGTLDHRRTLVGEKPQKPAGGFVGAVLRGHDAEEAKLSSFGSRPSRSAIRAYSASVRPASRGFIGGFPLPRREALFPPSQSPTERKKSMPSVPPSRS